MVINASSMSSATSTAEAPAFWAFQTFKAKKQSEKQSNEPIIDLARELCW
jgi:hypothetical protein